MGTFLFRWPHPDAKDVHVTGTFDDWGKSEQLNKVGEIWEKEVTLSNADEKIYYKFVVDDNWVIDPTAPQEDDGHYNVNNVLLPKDIKKHAAGASTAGASTAATSTAAASTAAAFAPAASTDSAAGATASAPPPLERTLSPPGAFPETPANEEEDKSFGVQPIPATSGIGNPISLPAGEAVPDQSKVTSNTVNSTATTSKEGYERDASAALPAVAGLAGAGAIGAAITSAFSKPEEKKNLIPESSLPMGADAKDTLDSGPHISSAAPASSTAALAAGVPLEAKREGMVLDPTDVPGKDVVDTAPGVPATVKESIAEAHQAPEAAASSEAVKEKSAMESELLKKTTSTDATGDGVNTAAAQTSYYGLATGVPTAVEKSMSEAHAPPEAAADASVVAEKSAVESELLKKVPSSDEAGEPAPTIAAATSETAPAATSAITDGKTASEAVPDTDTSTTTKGPSAGEFAGGAAIGTVAAAGTAAAISHHQDKEIEPPRTVNSTQPDVSTESAPAISKVDQSPGTVPILGASGTAAAAAVSDGTDDTPVPAVPAVPSHPSSVPLEKTEGDTTEYAPVRSGDAKPGVSSATAAAVSDGTEDPTLADEPAVKMMNQQGATDGSADAYDAATGGGGRSEAVPAAIAGTAATGAATGASGATPATAPTTEIGEQKTTTPAPIAAATSGASKANTPVKKIAGGDTVDSSPASSATKEKKKRNRLSRLYHKIVD